MNDRRKNKRYNLKNKCHGYDKLILIFDSNSSGVEEMESKTLYSRYKALSIYWKICIWLVLLFISYTLFGFLGIPRIAKYVLVQIVPESIHRKVEVGEVTFNPFKLNLRISDLTIKSRLKGKNFVNVKGLDLDVEAVSLIKRALVVSKLEINEPFVFFERDKKGQLNIEDLLTSNEAKDKDQETAPPKFSINNIEIKNGRLIFQDDLKGSIHKIEKVNIGIPFISNIDQDVRIYVKPYFSALINGSPLEFKGQTRPFAQDRDTRIDLKFTKIDLTKYLKYMPDYNGLKLKRGLLSTDLSIHFFTKAKPSIVLSGNATLENVSVAKKDVEVLAARNLGLHLRPSRLFSRHIVLETQIADFAARNIKPGRGQNAKSDSKTSKKDLLVIPHIKVGIVDINLAKGQVSIQDIQLHNPGLNFVLNKNGESNLQGFVDFVAETGQDTQKDAKTKADGTASKTSTVVSVSSFTIKGGRVNFADFSAPAPVMLVFYPLDCQLTDFSTTEGATFSYAVNTKVNKTGKLNIKGTGKLTGLNVEAALSISKVPLPPFQGYMDRFLNAELGRGHLSLEAKALFKEGEKNPFLNVKGTARVQNVLFFDKRSQEPFVSWKEIAAKNFVFSYAPIRFVADEIVLNRVRQNIVIAKDGTLNIAGLVKTEERKERSDKKTGGRASSSPAPQIKIKTVRFVSCRVKLVDRSLKQVFVREFDAINGTIKGLVNRPNMKAKVNIKALVDNRSRLFISGLVNPLAKPLFADLVIKVGGAGMTRFSPYAQKFLGYKIEKGKMFLDLHIKLEGNKLYVDNRLVLDQFDLGEQVPSKDAIHAPVKLAIALLKDRSGKIDLDIPVRGKLDDPEFSYRSAVLRAIMNIFIKAATSPFSLLGAVLGSDEKLDTVIFPPGSAKLGDEAKKKLDLLAKALRDRPALKVEITGYYSPVADKKGLLEFKFMHLLKKQKFKDLSNDEREKIENIDDIVIKPSEYEKYLEKAYKNASFKRPRNFIGMIKSQPREVMERMLKEHITVSESDLKNLASERAKAVANYLVQQGKVPQERVFLVAPKGKQAQGDGNFQGVRITLK